MYAERLHLLLVVPELVSKIPESSKCPIRIRLIVMCDVDYSCYYTCYIIDRMYFTMETHSKMTAIAHGY